MRAVRFHEHGGIDKLIYEEAPDPKVTGAEVLVRVGASLEVFLRRVGQYPGCRLIELIGQG